MSKRDSYEDDAIDSMFFNQAVMVYTSMKETVDRPETDPTTGEEVVVRSEGMVSFTGIYFKALPNYIVLATPYTDGSVVPTAVVDRSVVKFIRLITETENDEQLGQEKMTTPSKSIN